MSLQKNIERSKFVLEMSLFKMVYTFFESLYLKHYNYTTLGSRIGVHRVSVIVVQALYETYE